MAPQRAKGRAKIECSHLIISRVTRRLRRTGTGLGYQFWEVGFRLSVFGCRLSANLLGPGSSRTICDLFLILLRTENWELRTAFPLFCNLTMTSGRGHYWGVL